MKPKPRGYRYRNLVAQTILALLLLGAAGCSSRESDADAIVQCFNVRAAACEKIASARLDEITAQAMQLAEIPDRTAEAREAGADRVHRAVDEVEATTKRCKAEAQSACLAVCDQ